jgi:uncharacterized membrane protein
VALLILVDALVAIALITVVVSATAVHLARHRLQSVADGAALDAADALDRIGYYGAVPATPPGAVGGTGAGTTATPAPVGAVSLPPVPVSAATVQQSIDAYLAANPATSAFDSLQVVAPTGTSDGRTAQVSLATTVQLPLVGVILQPWGGGIPIQVTASARSRAGR